MGNTKANATYNPDERRHPPPTDFDESDRDSEMEKFIRNKYQYKKFLAPAATLSSVTVTARSSSPPVPIPRPPAKDPVPGRVGGSSLGERSDFDKVIRAPSRAKSTPIASSAIPGSPSVGRINVLSPPSPAIPFTSGPRVPVFEPTLPYRPSTAAALEGPYAAGQSASPWVSSPNYRNNTSSAPPVPPISLPARPYSSSSSSSAVQQPPLQYLPQSTITSTSSNPLWDDMLVLSGAPPASGYNSTTAVSQLGSSAFKPGITASGTLPTLGSAVGNMGFGVTPRSFSMPTTQASLSPVVTGASTYSTGSNASSTGAPNPLMGLNANSSALSLGAGSSGVGGAATMSSMGMGGSSIGVGGVPSANNPYSSISAMKTGITPALSATAAGNGNMSLSVSDAWSQPGQQQQFVGLQSRFVTSPTQEQQLSNAFGGMSLGNSSSSLNLAIGRTQFGEGTPSFGQQVQSTQSTGASSMASTASASLSFQQTYGLNNPYGVSSPAALFQSQSQTAPQPLQNSAPSQSSFARSMLPAHLKNQAHQQAPTPDLNPFGSGGSSWLQQQQQQQQQQQSQQAGQQAFGNLFAAAYGANGGVNGWR